VIIYAIVSGKGGVGKSTSTANIAACIAQKGKKTLALDIDKQGHTTKAFKMYNPKEKSIADVMVDRIDPKEVIKFTGIPGLDIIPASYEPLEEAPDKINLDINRSRTNRLKSIESLDYDYVVIDCPPDLGLLTMNVLAIADYVIVPVVADLWGIEGLGNIVKKIEVAREEHNPKLNLGGVFLVRDSRTTENSKVKKQLEIKLKDKFLKQTVRNSSMIGKATFSGKPIVILQPDAKVSLDYINLTKEVLEKCKK
jgi:chromosome partitioning protein